jgi:Tol biopolymer transport system component
VRTRISPPDESSTRPIMSSDGRKVIYSDPAGLNLWIYDIGSGSRRLLARPQGVQPTDGLIPVSTSATGRYVVAGGNFAGMFVLDTTTGTNWKLPGIGSQYSVALDISGDGRWVAYTWLGTTDPGGRNLHVWDRTTDQAVKLVDPPEQDGVESVSISSDGTRIAYTVKARRAAVARLETIARSGGSSTFIARSKNGISDVSIAGDGRMGSFCSRGTDLAPDSPAAPNLYTWS